jgi:hypothetical protein
MLTTLTNRLPAGAVAVALMLFGTSCQFIEPGNSYLLSAEQSKQIRSCAVGHLRVDAFGYPTCVTSDDENTGIAKQAVHEPIATSSAVSSQVAENSASSVLSDKKSVEEHDEWNRWDFACRRRVRDSLASPYGIYEQCMQDKKLSAESP